MCLFFINIRRNTRRKFSTEEKIRIVLDGLRGEGSIAELCRQEGINPNLYYRWSKDFLEAGKKRFFRRLLRSHGGEPRKIVTDKLRSYPVAYREVIPESIQYSHAPGQSSALSGSQGKCVQ